MRRFATLLFFAVLLLSAPHSASAGSLDGAKILGVLKAHGGPKNPTWFDVQDREERSRTSSSNPYCTIRPTNIGCRGGESLVSTSGKVGGDSYDIYVIVAGIPESSGLAGAEFMIAYNDSVGDGLEVFSWVSCGDLEFKNPAFPASRTGTRLVFNDCENEPDPIDPGYGTAMLGLLYVYAYSPDDFWIWPRTDTDYSFKLVDCDLQETTLELWNGGGSVGFGEGHPGWNPCLGFIDEFPGTCCLPTGCSQLQRLECEFRGGVYLGFSDLINLTPVPCTECDTPAEHMSWGRLKTRY